MSRISRTDAVQVMDRFRRENARVFLSGMGFGWRLGVEGSVAQATREEVRFVLRDGREVFALRMDMDDLEFWSGSPADVPPRIARGIEFLGSARAFVGIILPLRVLPEMLSGPVCDQEERPRERVFFCDLGLETIRPSR